jgi:hypothetical protein
MKVIRDHGAPLGVRRRSLNETHGKAVPITATGFQDEKSLVNWKNVSKGSRQIRFVTLEEELARMGPDRSPPTRSRLRDAEFQWGELGA